ncbi:fatty acid desaturase [Labrys wisconsinensis]|uniref:Omega-6 fatty acid desaturase (Delta-12 desaturase) n=1 Tax=Labrys wisconsinensis TaxID=425677 RepID=A0ABU0JDL2_9HYPH|nr:fatty acid desaturase [Labrys wisconsinensis]MDQ0472374.1 omega-6 fatty acid desaturase (delta-12 desaturase) [Labrys wisconsinensis]
MRSDQQATPAAAAIDARRWPKILSRYREPSVPRSVAEIAVTLGPLALLWVGMWAALHVGYWLSLLLAVPAAAFLVRLFMIQHDCSHDAFFRSRIVNAWVGRVIGVLTLTPHDLWRRTHAIHHATSGNLGRRGIGDVDTITVREYRARSWWGRLGYRLYRHPAVMFGLGPAYLFILQHRVPLGLMRGAGWQPWVSTMATNLGIAAVAGGLMWLIGIGPFLMVHLPVALIAASIGVWLFYVQHQFEDTVWEEDRAWDHPEAALHGSSHYDLPGVLRWLTANIGIHHVHHLSSRIPYYRLPEVLRDHPELANVGRLTLWQSFGCVRLVLWDEIRRKLVSFRTMRRDAAAAGDVSGA